VHQVNNFTFHYAFYVVMNWLPTYFDNVLHANLSSAGSTKMLPYLVMFVMSNAGNMGGEWLIARGAPVATARKTVNSVGESYHASFALLM
jgi:MFS transporter, ACS family, solute carrier family 17 (sodium-dependent inorganic phosphate cotransporter), other